MAYGIAFAAPGRSASILLRLTAKLTVSGWTTECGGTRPWIPIWLPPSASGQRSVLAGRALSMP
jgi:hypothetical protein